MRKEKQFSHVKKTLLMGALEVSLFGKIRREGFAVGWREMVGELQMAVWRGSAASFLNWCSLHDGLYPCPDDSFSCCEQLVGALQICHCATIPAAESFKTCSCADLFAVARIRRASSTE